MYLQAAAAINRALEAGGNNEPEKAESIIRALPELPNVQEIRDYWLASLERGSS
jgi:hypothetical protein